MHMLMVPPELRTKLGADAAEALGTMFAHYHEFATDRFERRLTEEVSTLRLELRVELERGLTGIRVEVERMRSDVIKWNLLFWIGQFAAVVTALTFMLNGR